MKRLIHPYSDLQGGQWLRGNLHTHTTRSDGASDPQTVLNAYAERGYGFLMISDHDIFTSPIDYKQWDSRGMVLINGNEVTANGPHLLHVGGNRFVDPLPKRQAVINTINATGGGWVIVNHPNWQGQYNHCSIEQLREWTGYVGMEIYNGVIERLDGSPYATNKWDMLLSGGQRVWAFANDDSHANQDIALGWNTAYVRERNVDGVLDALRNGRFYCSTGVVIRSIEVNGMTVRIETENADRIAGYQNVGVRVAVVDDRVIELTVPPHAAYIRFECYGRGGQVAWTQPFFIEAEPAAGGKEKSRFIENWHSSSLVTDKALAQTSVEHAQTLKMEPLAGFPPDHSMTGFVDIRSKVQDHGGLVYLSTELPSETDRRVVLGLGYDGPLRVWLNGQQIFDGPGTNPAVPDQTRVYADLKRGANQLLVALDSNGGKAWGMFARIV